MKKLFLKLLRFCLGKFQDEIISNINNTTTAVATQLVFERAALVTDALLDSNPNNAEQITDILKTTLASESFLKLEEEGIKQLSTLIKDENLVKVLVGTEKIRVAIFKALADGDPDNKAQITEIFKQFGESDEFVEYISLITQHLLTKKLKNGRNSK